MIGLAPPVSTATAIIEFVAPVPGFPDARTWAVEAWGEEASPFSLLRNVEVEGLEFVVVSPFLFFPDYAADVDDAVAASIGLTAPEDAVVWVVLNVGESVEDTTANLLGPIIVNTGTNQAVQAILHDPDLSTRARLLGE